MADPNPRGQRIIALLRMFSALVSICYLLIGFCIFALLIKITKEFRELHMNHGFMVTLCLVMAFHQGTCCMLFMCTIRGPPITMYIYGCVLACVFMVSLTSCLTIGIFRDSIRKDMETGYDMRLITSDPPNQNMLFVQKQLQCCGVNNYTDWLLLSPKQVIPKSCCIYEEPCITSNYNDVYQEGCYQKLAEFITKNLMGIIAGGAIVSFLPAVGSILTCYLAHQMEMKRNRRRGSDTRILK